MKWLGFRQVATKTPRIDVVDIKRRQAMQHVKDLAADIKAHGGEPIHAPTMRQGSGALLCGRDRFAATLLNGTKKLWVHVVECDDDEAKALELAENIYRRADNRAELIAQLVALKTQHLRAEDDAKRAAGEAVSEAPQHSPKARARREVAKAAGVSPAAVRKAEARAAKPAKEATNDAPEGGTVSQAQDLEAAPLPPGFETYGVELSAELRGRIEETIAFCKDMERDARHVLRCLTDMERPGTYTIAPAHIQQIRERAQALGHAVRAAMPAALCPYCKAQAAPMVNCNACGSTGVVGKHAGDHVPRELLATDVVMVAVNGQIVPLADSSAAPAAKPKKKGGKPIHVEVVDEVGAAPRELTIDRTAAEESEELF